ncbi:MAG: MBL fold metallo-hydrolase [Bryobacterales bacterium]|nr:MBL fold metallo-hydrolase [Bryobacterales bacterium]
MTQRRVWAGVFAGLAALGLAVTQSDAKPDTMEQAAPGVWFREGDVQDKGHCNNVVIEMKDYLIVVDANFPSGADLLLRDIRKVSKKPVKYVFDTHHHGDHAYGNPVWTKLGATTLAYVGVAEEMKRYEPKRWREAAETREDVRKLKLATAEPPRQTFNKPMFVLEDGNRRVEFHYFGWAHTRGDGFAYLPKEKIICTGDAVTNGPYNFTADGNIGNWPSVVAKAAALDVVQVLPGHGPKGGREVLSGEEAFMRHLRSGVDRAMKSGKKLNDLVTMKGGAPVATALKLPDSVKNWVGPFLPVQVKDTFEEISQGKPHGDIPH